MNKINEDYVIEYFQKFGCKLLSKYKNQRESIQYLCKCGKISTTSFYAFIKGSPYCWDCAAAKQAHSQEFVQSIFKERGCELFDLYKNNYTRMKFKCKCGEISTITFASFHDKGAYCVNCGGKKKLTIEKVTEKIKEANYMVASDKYITARTKIKLKCDKGHDCEISWNNFQKGKRCRTCFIETKWHKPEHRPFVLMCRSLLRNCLRNCLRNIQVKKTGKTEQMLGYDGKQLHEHITNHSNWNVVKDGVWHIDHIFPIKAFCDYNILDTTLINCLENIQPLTGKENLSKLAKYSKEEFETWLKSKNMKA